MTIGEKIKKIRTEKGMTQKELGDKCGLADSAIRRYELGGANPKMDNIQKMARALGVAYTDLLNYEKHPITEELLDEHPEIKKHLVESVILFMGNDLDNRLKTVLLNGDTNEIFEILDCIISGIEINEKYEVLRIYYFLKSKEDKLLEIFRKLNEAGKNEALKRIEELTEINKYTEPMDK